MPKETVQSPKQCETSVLSNFTRITKEMKKTKEKKKIANHVEHLDKFLNNDHQLIGNNTVYSLNKLGSNESYKVQTILT